MHATFAMVLLFAATPNADQMPTGGKKIPYADLQRIDVAERLGEPVDPELTLVDHDGRRTKLGSLFDGERPVLLTLNYYRCKTLCSTQLNLLRKALGELEEVPGVDYRLVTASIDPRDTPEIAAGKRKSYLEALDKGAEADWTFTTGGDVAKLAEQLGFKYFYDEEIDQYAHTAVLFFLSPQGRISRYLYGIAYAPRDLRFSLIDASEGRIGSTVDKIILSCFQFDSAAGTYGATAFGFMRLGGGLTLAVVAVLLGMLWYRERRRRKTELMQEEVCP